jgi:hypothetical protein
MYEFEELTTDYGFPIEIQIIEFLTFYNIPKENIVNIRIISNSRATIIFDSTNTKYDNSKREYRRMKTECDMHKSEIWT